MQFSALDRIALLYNDIFPSIGDRMLARLVEEAQAALKFRDDELTEIEYQPIDATRSFSYSVQKAAALVIEVEISPRLAAEVWKKLQELDREKRLSFALVHLFDKFEAMQKDDSSFA